MRPAVAASPSDGVVAALAGVPPTSWPSCRDRTRHRIPGSAPSLHRPSPASPVWPTRPPRVTPSVALAVGADATRDGIGTQEHDSRSQAPGGSKRVRAAAAFALDAIGPACPLGDRRDSSIPSVSRALTGTPPCAGQQKCPKSTIWGTIAAGSADTAFPTAREAAASEHSPWISGGHRRSPQWVDEGTPGLSFGADEGDVRDHLEVVAHGLRCGVLVLGLDGVKDRVVCHQRARRAAGA